MKAGISSNVAVKDNSAADRLLPHAAERAARSRLRRLLLLFFLLLTLPFALLLQKTFEQLAAQQYMNLRVQGEQFTGDVQRHMIELLRPEELRPSGQYQFFSVEEAPLLQKKELTFSPLAKLPQRTDLPGLIGYFQLTPDQRVVTPLLPDAPLNDLFRVAESYGIPREEVAVRLTVAQKLREIVESAGTEKERRFGSGAEERVAVGSVKGASEAPREEKAKDGSFEAKKQSLGRKLNTELWQRQRSAASPARSQAYRKPRKELILEPSADEGLEREGAPAAQNMFSNQAADMLLSLRRSEGQSAADSIREMSSSAGRAPAATAGSGSSPGEPAPGALAAPVKQVESSIDPFQLQVHGDHLIFFRRVWRDNQRLTQGFVVEKSRFFNESVGKNFMHSPVASFATLIVGSDSDWQAIYPDPTRAERSVLLLHRTPLPAPLHQLDLLLTVPSLPPNPGTTLVQALAAAFLCVLLLGLWLIYSLGMRQIALAQQRSDFVSAVSHELKTPLTSIRMYSEMLREGWVNNEQKARSYYDFIFFEAERLSRLISNVLQLSRLQKGGSSLELRPVAVSQLFDQLKSKISSQAEAAGFSLELELNVRPGQTIAVDEDAFIQIITNLVDNALKFSASSELKRIVVGCRQIEQGGPSRLCCFVRDFGPGIERSQIKRIFELFYRGESELTRSTPGTGIGLALVRALCAAMGAEVEVENQQPGAEFRVVFPLPQDSGPAA